MSNDSYVPLLLEEREGETVQHQSSPLDLDDATRLPDGQHIVGNETEWENRSYQGDSMQLARTDSESESALFRLSNPWLPSTATSFLLVVPLLIGNILIFYDLLGKIWTTTVFVFHLVASLFVARCYLCDDKTAQRPTFQILTSVAALVDIVFFGVAYPKLWDLIVNSFCTDFDGTDIIEWSSHKQWMELFSKVAILVSCLRSALIVASIFSWLLSYERFNRVISSSTLVPLLRMTRPWGAQLLCNKARLRLLASKGLFTAIVASGIALLFCLGSLATHVLPWPAPERFGDCDPLDDTECALPFPSFHHMKPDATSETGWRVNLQGDVLPPMRSGQDIQLTVLNEMDGFSTMAPLLFCMEGLKEAHEAGVDQLKGLDKIAESVTCQSITLLLDVKAKTLVPHSAQVDYTDERYPIIMVSPAAPLKHNTHYALAVVNATDVGGVRLNPTKGVRRLMADESSPRRSGYMEEVIPSLEVAASWFTFSSDQESLQLLFDFQTTSEESQLGTIRSVRDGTIAHVDSPDEWSWEDHVRTVRIDNHDCQSDYKARTVHASIDVPWFLEDVGPGQRGALVDKVAVKTGRSRRLGTAKFVLCIPCSVRWAALGLEGGKPLRSVVEFGHGLLSSRIDLIGNDFLHKMAHEEGYALVAMDFRGMSIYDFFLFAKATVSHPRGFQQVRDNVMQGYANKYALQHFVKHGLLSTSWFSFEKGQLARPVPTYDGKRPSQIYYGISQGGILGAGYSSLSGITGLIDRTILGSPGTPFASILARTIYAGLFNMAGLLNYYNSRHIRILLSLMQMGLDIGEGAGTLAAPIREPYPRTLLQTGWGDVYVPAASAEALARAFNASLLPNSPKSVYGLSVAEAANDVYDGPHVTLTELVYDTEYKTLPSDNTAPEMNGVHFCLREDPSIVQQTKEFINTGRVLNPCESKSACHRNKATCSFWLDLAGMSTLDILLSSRH